MPQYLSAWACLVCSVRTTVVTIHRTATQINGVVKSFKIISTLNT